MPENFLLLSGGAAAIGLYLAWYAAVNGHVVKTSHTSFPLVSIWRLARESVGMVARALCGRPTLCTEEDLLALGQLTRTSASASELEALVAQTQRYMLKHPVSYPQSQQDALLRLSADCAERIRWREDVQDLVQGIRQQHQAAAAYWEGTRQPKWRSVLGLAPDEQDPDVVRKAYRTRARDAHPDRGGSNEEMARVNEAMSRARDELGMH